MHPTPDRTPDGERAARHAAAAEDLIAEAGRMPEGMMWGFLLRAGAQAALAVYYELRAQR